MNEHVFFWPDKQATQAGPTDSQAPILAASRAVGAADDALDDGRAELRGQRPFVPGGRHRLHALFDVVGRSETTEVLIDDRPVPYARQLWLPLVWFFIGR